jgi:hypothetical protein
MTDYNQPSNEATDRTSLVHGSPLPTRGRSLRDWILSQELWLPL